MAAGADAADEDPTDIFDDALSTLFSVPPIAFSTSSPSHLYTYTPPSSFSTPSPSSHLRPIQLRLPTPSAENYTTLQANHLWLAAIFLADQLALGTIPIDGLRIAELGAGSGLPGIVALLKGASAAVSSDWDDEDVLETLRGNFERACGKERWQVVGHRWGTDPLPLLRAARADKDADDDEKFDALLLADVLWRTDAHPALLDSIFALLRPAGGVAHIAAGVHTGRGPIERFIQQAESRGARVKQQREVRWSADGWRENRAQDGEGEGEERGVVVYMTLHV